MLLSGCSGAPGSDHPSSTARSAGTSCGSTCGRSDSFQLRSHSPATVHGSAYCSRYVYHVTVLYQVSCQYCVTLRGLRSSSFVFCRDRFTVLLYAPNIFYLSLAWFGHVTGPRSYAYVADTLSRGDEVLRSNAPGWPVGIIFNLRNVLWMRIDEENSIISIIWPV